MIFSFWKMEILSFLDFYFTNLILHDNKIIHQELKNIKILHLNTDYFNCFKYFHRKKWFPVNYTPGDGWSWHFYGNEYSFPRRRKSGVFFFRFLSYSPPHPRGWGVGGRVRCHSIDFKKKIKHEFLEESAIKNVSHLRFHPFPRARGGVSCLMPFDRFLKSFSIRCKLYSTLLALPG